MKKTVVFDFDGVIHSYTSGYRGKTVIPDPPVAGIREAIHEIRTAGYQVIVVSTRCSDPEGLLAVKNWLNDQNITVDGVQAEKPPAICYIDDRAICFTGNTTNLLKEIREFRPWNKRGRPR